MVAQPAEKSCAESVQPFLASILEELMGPVSSGFSEVRSLFEKEVDELSQNFQTTKDSTQLKEVRRQDEELSENGLPEATRVLPSCPFTCPAFYSSSLSSMHLVTPFIHLST